jgi:hypothetical protein
MRDIADVPPVEDFEAKLELALIDEYLRQHGRSRKELSSLEAAERERLLHDAALYAANKLAEIDARCHYVEDLHRRE